MSPVSGEKDSSLVLYRNDAETRVSSSPASRENSISEDYYDLEFGSQRTGNGSWSSITDKKCFFSTISSRSKFLVATNNNTGVCQQQHPTCNPGFALTMHRNIMGFICAHAPSESLRKMQVRKSCLVVWSPRFAKKILDLHSKHCQSPFGQQIFLFTGCL